MSILLVEDDLNQAAAIEKALRASDREISRVKDNTRAVQFLRENVVDLVVLDWRIPDTSGLDLLHWIRANLGDGPTVLFLTARTLEIDVVAALNAGADEYIAKPFREVELAARINALLRRNSRNKKNANRIEVGGYVLDSVTRTLTFRGEIVELTTKEFSLANCLFNNLGNVVSRDLLSTLAWGRTLDGTSRSLDTHIYRLRQKLAIRPENGLQLGAVYMHGYRLDMINSFTAAAAGAALPC
ncbi:response regulator transcription factor [Burkholderia sp. FERM BP-3421]|jgi:DNA-binding response OmpR family regulator|uniref:response regulator transcription factor n=1 Tax=Burkholderia sp. FERM BP-3421 TaxID=1494466 RepID=UPI0023611DD0|nr:response regulator transcription factor [Burkholderia sp. FERM BP-3421]WDD92211.1 response regulator transcription factor [Burkholderia sp. FERM BP-3421]